MRHNAQSHAYTFKASGDSWIEKAYVFIRRNVAIIAKRQQTKPRCKRCFTFGWTKGRRLGVRFGCDGCAEMETFIDDLRELFRSEAETSEGKAVRK